MNECVKRKVPHDKGANLTSNLQQGRN